MTSVLLWYVDLALIPPQRISELERSEKALKVKLELLTNQEPSFLESLDLSAVDSPDVIYKTRIVEHEQMEQHLKQQVRARVCRHQVTSYMRHRSL